MRFHGYWRSSAAWRCRIAFNLKGVAPELVPVHLTRNGGEQKSAAYRQVNPQALVPALEVGGRILTQSLAILEWLDETVADPPLLPGDALDRAQIRAFALAVACDIHPLQNLRVQQYLRGELAQDQAGVDRWLARWLGDGLQALEGLLSERDVTPFAFGDSPTLADICLAPQLYSADRFGISYAHLPRISALAESYARHPAFVAAHAHCQPDSEIREGG
ncbi:maleylacetoacetate isomerase [Sphingobium sp. EM0848]|uniref:maleylacetoacetate isomerase n=1 Tax=Sphingobium sp. EM0848 TaxID=2743473 RepID=UPI00159C3E8C|nr:maleylacetoacetate isomerase [Sphingobium sp. EM0848]